MRWRKQGASGMAVMEISIPSGFEPDMTAIGNVAGIKRTERRGRNVVVYFNEVRDRTPQWKRQFL